MISRRRFVLTGLIAAPAVVMINHLMPIKMERPAIWPFIPEGAYGRDYETGLVYHRRNGLMIQSTISSAPRHRSFFADKVGLLSDLKVVSGNNVLPPEYTAPLLRDADVALKGHIFLYGPYGKYGT